MYDKAETDISWEHLREVIENLDEPVVIMGGWAVYFLVNEGYKGNTGRNYIGSRDIDLGFHIGEDLENSALYLTYRKLTNDLDFRPLSFGRLFKEMNRNTGCTLDPELAKKIPPYDIFPVYIDLIVDQITPAFTEHFGFTPIDEDLLQPIFQNANNRTEREEFNRRLWLPSPDLLLSMKVKSHPNRDKEHKRIKDLSDIVALVLYTGAYPKFSTQLEMDAFRVEIFEGDMQRVAGIIDVEISTIRAAIMKITKPL